MAVRGIEEAVVFGDYKAVSLGQMLASLVEYRVVTREDFPGRSQIATAVHLVTAISQQMHVIILNMRLRQSSSSGCKAERLSISLG